MLLLLVSAAWSRQMLSPLAKKGYGARRKAGDMVRGAAVLWRRGTWKDGRGLCPPSKMERCRSSAWSRRTLLADAAKAWGGLVKDYYKKR